MKNDELPIVYDVEEMSDEMVAELTNGKGEDDE